MDEPVGQGNSTDKGQGGPQEFVLDCRIREWEMRRKERRVHLKKVVETLWHLHVTKRVNTNTPTFNMYLSPFTVTERRWVIEWGTSHRRWHLQQWRQNTRSEEYRRSPGPPCWILTQCQLHSTLLKKRLPSMFFHLRRGKERDLFSKSLCHRVYLRGFYRVIELYFEIGLTIAWGM